MASSSQRAIVKTILSEGRKAKATRKQKKAAIAAGIVESNLTNTPGGDRDSVGVFQIRSGIHGPIGGSVSKSAAWFFKNAKSADKGQSSGQLAQDVERSAYPDKYGKPDVQQRAGKLLRSLGGSGGGSGGGGKRTGGKTRTIPGVDNSSARSQTILNYLQNRDRPDSLLGLAQGLKDTKSTPDRTVTTPGRREPKRDSAGSSGNGVVKMDGYQVNASIAADLKYARAHGWKGKVTSGYRSNADQARVCATGVKPCAPVGQSMHRFKRKTKGAVDVSDGSALGKYLPKGSKLKHAGSADPPHWSKGAQGGSY